MCLLAHTLLPCVLVVCSRKRVGVRGVGWGILCVKDEDDLLRGSDLNDVLSSPGIPVCEWGFVVERASHFCTCLHK